MVKTIQLIQNATRAKKKQLELEAKRLRMKKQQSIDQEKHDKNLKISKGGLTKQASKEPHHQQADSSKKIKTLKDEYTFK